MFAFRIFNPAYGALDSSGAVAIGGRWNPIGTPVIYCSANFEGSLLEQLARAGIGRLPRGRRVARIEIPEGLFVESVDSQTVPDWRSQPVSRAVGTAWVETAGSVALVVPSFPAQPWGLNLLLNPAHPDFADVRVEDISDVSWDPRLV